MRTDRSLAKTLGTRTLTLAATLVAATLVATPMFVGASRALATSDEPAAVEAGLRLTPVAVAPVEAPAPAKEGCLRKVRVVYGGYGTPEGCAGH